MLRANIQFQFNPQAVLSSNKKAPWLDRGAFFRKEKNYFFFLAAFFLAAFLGAAFFFATFLAAFFLAGLAAFLVAFFAMVL